MIIRKDDDFRASIIRHIKEQLGPKERDGMHLSDLIYCGGKAFFRKLGKTPGMTDDQAVTFWVGHAAQYFILPVRQEDSATITVDGVTMTPDAQNQYFGGVEYPLVEVKTTRASMGKFQPGEYPHYITQVKGYCKGAGRTDAHLLVVFLRGDYKAVMSDVLSWHIQFTQEEIDANWAEMLRRKAILEEALRTGEFPKEVWKAWPRESQYCECKSFCPMYNPSEEGLK